MFIPYCPSGPESSDESDEQWEVYFFSILKSILYKNLVNCIEISVLSRVDSDLKRFSQKWNILNVPNSVLDTCRENNDQFWFLYKYYFDNLVIGGLKRDLERKIFSRAVN